MKETRLALGKQFYEAGQVDHHYAVEYAQTLTDEPTPKKAPKKKKKVRAKRW